LTVSAASFFQSGPAAAALLVDRVAAAAGPVGERHLLDAYGGIGLFALGLGARRCTLVEANPWACADAAANLSGRDVAIRQQRMEEWTPEPADLVVADPARSGRGAAGVDRLAATGAGDLVLVSCDPVAMARDAALLGAHGYRLDYAEVVELFPHTHHVEVVSRFAL
jgi:23S rRNA (uracil1939-C5)-methyltransferase